MDPEREVDLHHATETAWHSWCLKTRRTLDRLGLVAFPVLSPSQWIVIRFRKENE